MWPVLDVCAQTKRSHGDVARLLLSQHEEAPPAAAWRFLLRIRVSKCTYQAFLTPSPPKLLAARSAADPAPRSRSARDARSRSAALHNVALPPCQKQLASFRAATSPPQQQQNAGSTEDAGAAAAQLRGASPGKVRSIGAGQAAAACGGTPCSRRRTWLNDCRLATATRPSRKAVMVCAVATSTKTVKIGTRGSPLALAQAYLTRDLLKVGGSCRSQQRRSRRRHGSIAAGQWRGRIEAGWSPFRHYWSCSRRPAATGRGAQQQQRACLARGAGRPAGCLHAVHMDGVVVLPRCTCMHHN